MRVGERIADLLERGAETYLARQERRGRRHARWVASETVVARRVYAALSKVDGDAGDAEQFVAWWLNGDRNWWTLLGVFQRTDYEWNFCYWPKRCLAPKDVPDAVHKLNAELKELRLDHLGLDATHEAGN